MPDTPTALMLFAAGLGTRMGALTQDNPKPLIEVAGKALIDHAMDLVRGAGITHVVANTHYQAEKIAAHLEPQGVTISHETPERLETGGGLRNALPILGTQPVFTLNSDAIWTGRNPLCALAKAWNPHRMDALLMLVAPENAHAHSDPGDFNLAEDGRLTRGPGHIYGGAQIIKTEGLAEVREGCFSLNLLWEILIARQRVFGLVHRGEWCDVGTPAGITEACALLDESAHV